MEMIAQILEGVVFYGWSALMIPAVVLAVWILIYATKKAGDQDARRIHQGHARRDRGAKG